MTKHMEYPRINLRDINKLRLPAIGLISVILNGCAIFSSEPSPKLSSEPLSKPSPQSETDKTSQQEKADPVSRNVMLSEAQGRVLLVRDTRYKVAQKNMPLIVNDRIITIENARAAIDYVSIDDKDSLQVSCTVRIPGDSQFTVKDDIDCISGTIIANNMGEIESEEISRPFIGNPEKQTRIAQHKSINSKKTRAPLEKKEPITRVETGTNRQNIPAIGLNSVPVKKQKREKPVASTETVQAIGAIANRGPGVQIVQKVVSADKTSIGVENQEIGADIHFPAYVPVTTVGAVQKTDIRKPATPPKNPVLKSPDTVMAGTSFAVNWQGSDQPYDYITIVAATAGPGAYDDYVYTKEGDWIVLDAPQQPGQYEIRYVEGRTQKTLSRRMITIRN